MDLSYCSYYDILAELHRRRVSIGDLASKAGCSRQAARYALICIASGFVPRSGSGGAAVVALATEIINTPVSYPASVPLPDTTKHAHDIYAKIEP